MLQYGNATTDLKRDLITYSVLANFKIPDGQPAWIKIRITDLGKGVISGLTTIFSS